MQTRIGQDGPSAPRPSLHLMIIPGHLQHGADEVQLLLRRLIISQPAYLNTQVLRPFDTLLEAAPVIILCRELDVLIHELVLVLACPVFGIFKSLLEMRHRRVELVFMPMSYYRSHGLQRRLQLMQDASK